MGYAVDMLMDVVLGPKAAVSDIHSIPRAVTLSRVCMNECGLLLLWHLGTS